MADGLKAVVGSAKPVGKMIRSKFFILPKVALDLLSPIDLYFIH